ncbi:MAG: 50S ribosome-binding GTPase [Thermoplasmata archaeon]|nr:50S ribosome-binding GTPase [Thermoplasmata archaeon]
MKEIPTVLTSNEIIDKVLRRASSVTVKHTGNRIADKKNLINAKIDCVEANVVQILARYEKTFPEIENLSPFEKELIDILIGCEQLHHALAAIKWCRQTVRKIAEEAKEKLRRGRQDALEQLKKEYYGRVSSVIKQVSVELDFLNKSRDVLVKIPHIDVSLPTVVIAGFPNVGKSTLVKKISSAEPEIAPYPFTTKGLIIGHATLNLVRYQFIDTPGLLDRPLGERNSIEKQTILALKHLADIILFLIDPTGYSGSVEQQEKLLGDLQEEFKEAVFIVAETKADVLKRDAGRFRISAETGEGVDALIEEIKKRFRETRKYREGTGQRSSGSIR